jgi:hypothetical protein
MLHNIPEFIVESPFDLIEAEGIDDVHRIMAPCRNCGELRPRDEFSMAIDGTCHLCRANADVRKRDTRKILSMWEDLDEAAFDEGDADEHEPLEAEEDER